MATTDNLVLLFAAAAVLGEEQTRKNIYNVLSWAGNSGSGDVATDKKDTATIGNVDPNFCGMGQFAEVATSAPPLGPGSMGPMLDPVPTTHPGRASAFITNFGQSSLIGR